MGKARRHCLHSNLLLPFFGLSVVHCTCHHLTQSARRPGIAQPKYMQLVLIWSYCWYRGGGRVQLSKKPHHFAHLALLLIYDWPPFCVKIELLKHSVRWPRWRAARPSLTVTRWPWASASTLSAARLPSTTWRVRRGPAAWSPWTPPRAPRSASAPQVQQVFGGSGSTQKHFCPFLLCRLCAV